MSSPIAQDTGGTIFSSFVPQLIHKPNGNDPFQLTANLALSGDLALKNVIHLPYGFKGNNGALFGVEPDGVGISPDGTFAILAHETNQRAKHLQGFSVIDLRAGLENMTQQSYCIFDIDPTLLANTVLSECPFAAPAAPYPTDANKLPRLDPASVEIVDRGGQLLAALAIERYDPSATQLAASTKNETRGSVLFLDVAQALSGVPDNVAVKIDRVPIGMVGARIEAIDSAKAGRWIFVSISNGGADRGTFARLELLTKNQD